LRNRSLVLLSGEDSTLPEAEARALFLTYDPGARFERAGRTVLLVDSEADPDLVSRRVAYSRRVGLLIGSATEASAIVAGRTVRFRAFGAGGAEEGRLASEALAELGPCEVNLRRPDFEFTFVREGREYLALTRPGAMRQGWHLRRPRGRPYFHPSAIFPKLSRALLNLARCKEGGTVLDLFSGTGSILIEAAEVGMRPAGLDRSEEASRGALANMGKLGQSWLGVVKGDAFSPPFSEADAVVTDVPYGRAASTMGVGTEGVVKEFMRVLPHLLRKGSCAVVMHPKSAPLRPGEGLAHVEEHNLYVHKLLTRTITVLRRE
jgi:tRNA (guanine10-N2)-dimethyltransferase